MLTNIVQHKHLGDIDNIFFVLRNALSEKSKPIADIKKYCTDKSIELIFSIDGILALLEFVGFVTRIGDSLKLNNEDSQKWVRTITKTELSNVIFKTIFIKMKDELLLNDFFSLEKIKFDATLNQISIQNNSIPLRYSPLKNLLINIGGLKPNPILQNHLIIDKSLECFFETELVPWIKREKEFLPYSKNCTPTSIESFFEIQKLKNQYGQEAEEFVLNYEKTRLLHHSSVNLVRRISNFDIGAGYDIVSFESQDSQFFDRFIEVKSYKRFMEFYWSKNEINVAEIKRNNYFLYLVNREQLDNINYQPIIIQNPFHNIFNNQDWQKESQNWLVKYK